MFNADFSDICVAQDSVFIVFLFHLKVISTSLRILDYMGVGGAEAAELHYHLHQCWRRHNRSQGINLMDLILTGT